MRLVIQNVLNASVEINNETYSKINRGFLILVSFNYFDNKNIIEKMCNKISKLRVFMDNNHKTNLSIFDISGEILSISQFTLYANIKDGNRPSFTDCLSFDKALDLYNYFNEYLIKLNLNVKTGIFGADMKINLVNDGPFTLMLDSEKDLKL